MCDITVAQREHLAMHECHRLVVAHQHATLTPGSVHVPGTSPGATGIAPEPFRLGRHDEVALGRVVDLAFLHQLRQRVVDELAAGSLHRWEGVSQGRPQGVEGCRLPLRSQLEDGPAQSLRQWRELSLRDRSHQTVLYVTCCNKR